MLLLLQAYLELREEGKLSRGLVLAGRKGWKIENLLQQIQKEHEMEKSDDNDMPGVQMTGFVDEEDLPVLYQMADCFVFPSLYEGFGIPPLEAMQMGTVVISSDAPAMKEVLSDGAYYFQNNNKEDLKRAMLRVMSEKEDSLEKRKTAGKERCGLLQYRNEAAKLLQLWKEEIR